MAKALKDVYDGARQAEIAEFVRRFLVSLGAPVEVGEGRLVAHLGRELAHELGTGERLALRFAPDDGEDGGGPFEFVTFGHPLLDRMLEMAKGRGAAARLMFAPALDPEFVRFALTAPLFGPAPYDEAGEERRARERPEGESGAKESPAEARGAPPEGSLARGLMREVRRVRFANAQVRVRSSRLVHQMQALFRFKVSLIADEKRESVVTLVVDPVSEEADRPIDLDGAVSLAALSDAEQGERHAYTLRRLYRRACELLAERIEPAVREFESETALRMARELNRIEEYYRGLVEERLEPLRGAFRKLSAAGIRVDLARTWQSRVRYSEQVGRLRSEADEIERLFRSELQGLNAERERRLQELREKHQARAEVSLSQAALVMAPRIEWSLALSGRRRREITLLYDVLRRRLVDYTCESCGAPLEEPAYLCGCESVVCAGCHAACPGCGADHCPQCSPLRCHVCRGPVCPACDSACPLGSAVRPLDLPAVCVACRGESCPTCRSLAALLLEGAM